MADQAGPANQLKHLFGAARSGFSVKRIKSVCNVAGDAEVGEKSGLLGDHRSAAMAGLDVELLCRLVEQAPIEHNSRPYGLTRFG
jgi:hypothetical protein